MKTRFQTTSTGKLVRRRQRRRTFGSVQGLRAHSSAARELLESDIAARQVRQAGLIARFFALGGGRWSGAVKVDRSAASMLYRAASPPTGRAKRVTSLMRAASLDRVERMVVRLEAERGLKIEN